MSNGIKSTFKPFLDEFEKIGSQTAGQAVQAVKQVASDVVAKPIQEAVGTTKVGDPTGTGTNEDLKSGQQSATAKAMADKQMAKMQADDQRKAQQQMAQIRQNLKALMTPPKPPPEKPIYYKMWEDMEKKKQEKQEIEYKKQEESAAVKAAGKSTGERKKGIGG